MKIALCVIVAAAVICWILQAFAPKNFPIGAIGTAVAVLGPLALIRFAAFRRGTTADQYAEDYIRRKVEYFKNGNIIG